MSKRKDADKPINDTLIEKIELILPGLFLEAAVKFGFTSWDLTKIETLNLEETFRQMGQSKPHLFFLFADERGKRHIFTERVSLLPYVGYSSINIVCAPFEGYFKPTKEYLAAQKPISFDTLKISNFDHGVIKDELEHVVYPTLRRVFLINQLDEKFVPER